MCLDEDEDLARRAFVAALLGYALGQPGTQRPRSLGYRAHFDRMGFADILSDLDEMRNKGVSEDRIIEAFPPGDGVACRLLWQTVRCRRGLSQAVRRIGYNSGAGGRDAPWNRTRNGNYGGL